VSRFLLVFLETAEDMFSVHDNLSEVNLAISEIVEDCWDMDGSEPDGYLNQVFEVYTLDKPIKIVGGVVKEQPQ